MNHIVQYRTDPAAPWQTTNLGLFSDRIEAQVASRSWIVGYFCSRFQTDTLETRVAEERQDMRLADSAPDLLAALIRARNHLIMDIDRDGKGIQSTDTPEALAQVRAAIDKATGDTQ